MCVCKMRQYIYIYILLKLINIPVQICNRNTTRHFFILFAVCLVFALLRSLSLCSSLMVGKKEKKIIKIEKVIKKKERKRALIFLYVGKKKCIFFSKALSFFSFFKKNLSLFFFSHKE